MKCVGCGEELDGLIDHISHICPSSKNIPYWEVKPFDEIKDKDIDISPMPRRECVIPMGRAMYEAVEECLKEMIDGKHTNM